MVLFLKKLCRFIDKQTRNTLWLLFKFLPYYYYFYTYQDIHNIRTFKWYNWHNGAKCLTGFSKSFNTPVFLKTDNIYKVSDNEYEMTSLFYNSSPKSCPKPLKYIRSHASNTIIFKRIEGYTLAEILQSSELSSKTNWDIFFKKLLSIIVTLENLNMIHRDLTPFNIIVKINERKENLELYIIDFAFAGLVVRGLNDKNLNINELSHLGLTFKPDKFHWDDAYSALKILECIEASTNKEFLFYKDLFSKKIGTISHSYAIKEFSKTTFNTV